MADTLQQQNKPQICAEPTKSFFVEMLTRDIPLEQAVLDLVDNSVDGAKAMRPTGEQPFEGRQVDITFSQDGFRIVDNCGGFDSKAARDYAFRFGRPAGTPRTEHSIGQFGVGMKRALFKFGNHFVVRSATTDDEWAVEVNVPEWESSSDGWYFPWAQFTPDENVSKARPGTDVFVDNLRPEVRTRFSTRLFENLIIGLIKSKHRQFISDGLSISVNGQHLDATNLYLLVRKDFQPGTDEILFQDRGEDDVNVRIITGIGHSSPREAGWYVICNGRVVLEADRSSRTGWGLLEEQSDTIFMPSFHNQFARFRGIVSFDSKDSSRVPWNTTKTDVDHDNHVWQRTFGRMMEMMRPVISFLNDLDNDIDEHTREHSPLLDFVSNAESVKAERLPARAAFAAPARGSIKKGQKTVKIQYSKPVDQVDFLMNELSVASAKAVGEKTFELIFQSMRDE
ncbi:MAG: ATP-binding protein [Pseudomonadota bacterium]|jgi:hypothetical protein